METVHSHKLTDKSIKGDLLSRIAMALDAHQHVLNLNVNIRVVYQAATQYGNPSAQSWLDKSAAK